MSQFIVLPKPLPASSIALGQLLSNPLDLKSASKKPTSKPACNKSNTQSHYVANIFQDEEGRFFSSSDKTNTSSGRVVLIAKEMTLTSLADPAGAFEALRHDTETQTFLRKSALRRQSLYFVTGIKRLLNASYGNLLAKEAVTAGATGRQSKSFVHLRRDSAELELDGETRSTVFAVELMKVTCLVGGKDEPHTPRTLVMFGHIILLTIRTCSYRLVLARRCNQKSSERLLALSLTKIFKRMESSTSISTLR